MESLDWLHIGSSRGGATCAKKSTSKELTRDFQRQAEVVKLASSRKRKLLKVETSSCQRRVIVSSDVTEVPTSCTPLPCNCVIRIYVFSSVSFKRISISVFFDQTFHVFRRIEKFEQVNSYLLLLFEYITRTYCKHAQSLIFNFLFIRPNF